MTKQRLDQALVAKKLAPTRSQAENYVKLGYVKVNGKIIFKPGELISEQDNLELISKENYVSRAGLKLASVATKLQLDFAGQIVMDVGSSTGGFTDYALQHGAAKVYAVDVGTDQLHHSLRTNPLIELHEKTDIRHFKPDQKPDIVLLDVSFVSLRNILPHISKITDKNTLIIAMLKPQFEAFESHLKHKGVIKNDAMRRQILQDFELWVKKLFVIKGKADSDIAGAKGNRERFYSLVKNQSLS